MLVVDASVLFEVVADATNADAAAAVLSTDDEHAAPSLIDAEVLHVIQRQHRNGSLDATAATQAVDDLRDWPGERWPHRGLLTRAWALRSNLRSYDALYVALAEALQAPLVTLDTRLAAATGPACEIIVP